MDSQWVSLKNLTEERLVSNVDIASGGIANGIEGDRFGGAAAEEHLPMAGNIRRGQRMCWRGLAPLHLLDDRALEHLQATEPRGLLEVAHDLGREATAFSGVAQYLQALLPIGSAVELGAERMLVSPDPAWLDVELLDAEEVAAAQRYAGLSMGRHESHVGAAETTADHEYSLVAPVLERRSKRSRAPHEVVGVRQSPVLREWVTRAAELCTSLLYPCRDARHVPGANCSHDAPGTNLATVAKVNQEARGREAGSGRR